MKKTTFLLAAMICLRMISYSQYINTYAGGGFSGLGDGGQATSAELSDPHGIAFDLNGNLYVADVNNERLRKITKNTGIITTLAGTGSLGFNGNNTKADTTEFNVVWDVDVDAAGNVYIADMSNNIVRKLTISTGLISTFAGKNPTNFSTFPYTPNGGYSGDGGLADTSKIYGPVGVAHDAAGNIYIAEMYGNRIRKVTVSTGIISTIAGTSGGGGYNGDGIQATTAQIQSPTGVAVDAAGNVYIADQGNYRIRKITASTGLISTIAGNGGTGFSGDGALATAAQVYPEAIEVDASQNVYLTDVSHTRVRKIDAGTGIINTIAGDGSNGYNGDGILATTAQLSGPAGIALDASGNVYFSDAQNNRIRNLSSAPTGIKTISAVVGAISIYPNPFHSSATLSFKQEQNNLSLVITDVLGRQVRTASFSGSELTIEKADLKEGIYFLQIFSDNALIANQKFVVQ